MFASSPVGLAFLDTRLRFCRVNEAFAAMTGLSVRAHVGRTPMDLVPGIDPRQYLPHLRAVLAGTPPPAALTITSDPRRSDRATRSWTVTFHPVRVSGGRVRGVGVAAVDVTEQAAAEEARRREEATARLVLESAPNGMLLVDAGGSIVAVNPEAERLFGYAAAELVGRSVEVLVPERSRAAHPRLRAGFVAVSIP